VGKRTSINIINDLLQVGLDMAGEPFVSLGLNGTRLNAWTSPRLSDGSLSHLFW
jgi:hypothetical protein